MRNFAVAGALALVMTFVTHARATEPYISFVSVYSGKDLHAFCSAPSGQQAGACIGYSTAIADMLINGQAIGGWKACIPDTASALKIRDVVKFYLARNPQEHHYKALTTAAKAIALAYPCQM